MKTSRPAQAGFVSVAQVSEVPEGSMYGVAVSGKPIVISRIGGKFYATDAICSHLYAYLARGELSGNIVTCPFHDAKYDITTGKVVENIPQETIAVTGMRATDVRTYEVKVVGDDIQVRV